MEGIDALLARARRRLRRLGPHEAWRAARDGAFLVDIRPESYRRVDGELPDALVIERNHLEWRLDPASSARIPEATAYDIAWVVVCDEGYASSLAAAALHDIGLRAATDLIGGFQAWRAAGLPVVRPPTPTPPRGPGQQTSGTTAPASEPTAPTSMGTP